MADEMDFSDNEGDDDAAEAAFEARLNKAVEEHVQSRCIAELAKLTQGRPFKSAVVSGMVGLKCLLHRCRAHDISILLAKKALPSTGDQQEIIDAQQTVAKLVETTLSEVEPTAWLAWASAQRVSVDTSIEASIRSALFFIQSCCFVSDWSKYTALAVIVCHMCR